MKQHRIIYVEWVDSRNITSHWDRRKACIKKARSADLVRSVGFVIDDTKEHFLIAMDYDSEDDQIHSASTIPKGMIKKLREL